MCLPFGIPFPTPGIFVVNKQALAIAMETRRYYLVFAFCSCNLSIKEDTITYSAESSLL